MKETITKEQVKEYINKNFGVFFVDALAKYVKDVIFPQPDNESDEEHQTALEEYREELKQLIWEAVSNGVLEYLRDGDGEAVSIICKELSAHFALREPSITISFKND